MILEGFCGISMFGCTDVRRRMHFDSHAHGNDTNSYNMVCVYSRLDPPYQGPADQKNTRGVSNDNSLMTRPGKWSARGSGAASPAKSMLDAA